MEVLLLRILDIVFTASGLAVLVVLNFLGIYEYFQAKKKRIKSVKYVYVKCSFLNYFAFIMFLLNAVALGYATYTLTHEAEQHSVSPNMYVGVNESVLPELLIDLLVSFIIWVEVFMGCLVISAVALIDMAKIVYGFTSKELCELADLHETVERTEEEEGQ